MKRMPVRKDDNIFIVQRSESTESLDFSQVYNGQIFNIIRIMKFKGMYCITLKLFLPLFAKKGKHRYMKHRKEKNLPFDSEE